MYMKMLLLVITVLLASCTTTQTIVTKKSPTQQELKSYISIRNSQQVIEHGYSNKKNYASNYRYLTQKYIDLIIPELRRAKVKMNLSGENLLSIELYEIYIPSMNKMKQRNGLAKLTVRMKLAKDKSIEVIETKKLKNNKVNVNTIIYNLIVSSVKKSMHDKNFLYYLNKHIE